MSAPAKQTVPSLDATRQLAEFAAGLRYANLVEEERRAVRRHVLDTLGAIVAGSGQDVTRIVCETFKAAGLSGTAVAAGIAQPLDLLSAMYVMGTAAHGLELDDGYRAGSVHPGAVVVPAALAVAATQDRDGASFMTAVATGYEAATRLAEAIHPQSRQRGFHNTSLVGPLAAAVATGVLRGHDAATVEQTLGLAASTSAGLFAFLHGGGEVKRVHAGHAAREGTLAAMQAERGLTGPLGVLEQKDGLFQAFSTPEAAARFKISRRPDLLAVTRCYMKPYACCRHLHPAIDGVLQIMSEEKLCAGDVQTADIATYAIAAEHAHTGWGNMASAQMSFPFCIGLALEGKPLDIADFDEATRKDAAVAVQARKVKIGVDRDCDTSYPSTRSAKVRITTETGQQFERFIDEPYGSAKTPLDDIALKAKFMRLATPVLGDARAEAVVRLVDRLDTVKSMSELSALLQRPA